MINFRVRFNDNVPCYMLQRRIFLNWWVWDHRYKFKTLKEGVDFAQSLETEYS